MIFNKDNYKEMNEKQKKQFQDEYAAYINDKIHETAETILDIREYHKQVAIQESILFEATKELSNKCGIETGDFGKEYNNRLNTEPVNIQQQYKGKTRNFNFSINRK